jgi:hypothetical protein
MGATMLTDDELDIVAMALRDAVANRYGRGRKWLQLPEGLRQQYRNEARIVIATYEKVNYAKRNNIARVPQSLKIA